MTCESPPVVDPQRDTCHIHMAFCFFLIFFISFLFLFFLFFSFFFIDLRVAASGRSAAVGTHGDRHAVLGLDGEADLGEVGELLKKQDYNVRSGKKWGATYGRSGWVGEKSERLSARAGERLAARVLNVGCDGLDVVDRDAPVGCEERELVDGHVLEHALGVALEALRELGLLVRIVVHLEQN